MALFSFQSFLQRSLLLIIIVFVGSQLTALAQEGNGQLRMTPTEIKQLKAGGPHAPGSSNLSAVQEIVIAGNPSQAGLYTIMLKVKAHTRIPAHLHPDSRMAMVHSGTWYFGYGDVFDEKKLKKLPAGSIYSEVINQNHFAMTGDEDVVVIINGYGPSGVQFVNPKDDPRNKK
ncbi:MAG: cupin domain-containing protein [Chitinophagaceae bacterium]